MSILCPSAPCSLGALLIGRAVSPTEVAILPEPIVVNAAFVAEAGNHRAPEKRFRFAAPCKAGGCSNWDGHKCTVPEVTSSILSSRDAGYPVCGIRSDCRWFDQDGFLACSLCVQVTTQRDY